MRARGTQGLTYQLRLALEPECLKNSGHRSGRIPGMERMARDTQAVCGFRCWASKRTPFFQIINVIAAILRARVRRAISGRITVHLAASTHFSGKRVHQQLTKRDVLYLLLIACTRNFTSVFVGCTTPSFKNGRKIQFRAEAAILSPIPAFEVRTISACSTRPF